MGCGVVFPSTAAHERLGKDVVDVVVVVVHVFT